MQRDYRIIRDHRSPVPLRCEPTRISGVFFVFDFATSHRVKRHVSLEKLSLNTFCICYNEIHLKTKMLFFLLLKNNNEVQADMYRLLC